MCINGTVLTAGTRLLDVRKGGVSGEWELHYATPFSHQEFVEKALSLPHPVEAASALEPPLARAVFDLLALGPKVVKARRASALERLRSLAQQLAPAEERLHAQLVGEVRAVLRGKRLLLLKKLLDEVGYQDPTLFTELCQGFRLTGHLPSTPEFP
jgi:hypothetical protein